MKSIQLTELMGWDDEGPVLEAITVNVNSVISYSSESRTYRKPCTCIKLDTGLSINVYEKYDTVRKLMEDSKYDVTKACYVFEIAFSIHYIPIDLVTRFHVHKDSKHVTLYVGLDEFKTKLTGNELKATIIDVKM